MFRNLFIFMILHSVLLHGQLRFTDTGDAAKLPEQLIAKALYSGRLYEPTSLLAGHLTLPFGSVLKVVNQAHTDTLEVVVAHRGPFEGESVIMLSEYAWNKLGLNENNKRVNIVYTGQSSIQSPVLPPGKVFYLLNASRIVPNGYGVQLGVFSHRHNVLNVVDTLESQYKHECILQVVDGETPLYRLIYGRYASSADADTVKQVFTTSFPDCFVVNYNEL